MSTGMSLLLREKTRSFTTPHAGASPTPSAAALASAPDFRLNAAEHGMIALRVEAAVLPEVERKV